MKILFVIDGLGTGGAERSLAEMLPGLDRAGIQTQIACLHERSPGVQADVIARGTEVRFLRGTNVASRVAELRRIARASSPDLIHTTIFSASLVGRLASVGSSATVLTSLVNTPYVPVRLRDPDIRRASLAVVRALDSVTARRLTDHFHAISRTVARWAIEDMRLDPHRITVVERGRDSARLGVPGSDRRARVRQRLGLTDENEVVISVGRQEYQKGHRYLLEAVERLAHHRPKLVLLLAGRRGSSSYEIDRLVNRPSLRRVVRILGHRDDVADLLAASDVFAFPSLYEGLGCSVIEAMALSLPIVASDIPAVREIVEDGRNAMLVPPESARPLADALETLLNDPARAMTFGGRGREIFLDRFTLERSTRQMVELYERLIGSRTIDGARAAIPFGDSL